MITEIKSQKKTFALIFDLRDLTDGSHPVTDPSWSIQILLMKRKAGYTVFKHTHKKILKKTKQPQEALVVIKGEIIADIFDEKGKFISKNKISAGQCLLIVRGAHEVKVTKDACVYAFKDGPYVDDKISL